MDALPRKPYLCQKIRPLLHIILTILVRRLENGMSATTLDSIDSSIPSCVMLTSMGKETVHPFTILSATFSPFYQNSAVPSFVEQVKRFTITFLSMTSSRQTFVH